MRFPHVAAFGLALGLVGCADPRVRSTAPTVPASPHEPSDTTDTVALDTSTTVTFVVASDLHFLSPRLVESPFSPSLAQYRIGDRKMILQGPALLHSFLDSIRAMKPTFVLITGDLTKDGELASHEDMADSLQTLVDAGIRVIVGPGNHDVGMFGTQGYSASGSYTTQSVSAATFARIYRSCGYGSAISRDAASLSYTANITKGLRIVVLDPMAFRDYASGSTSQSWGTLQQGTLDWLWAQLDKARADGVDILGAIHFNVVEHFEGEATNSISSAYMIRDFRAIGQKMAERGLHAVFSGHFHATDITTAMLGSTTITDIETGALITPPNRFRSGTISRGLMTIASHRIREIDYDLGDTAFVAYADSFLYRPMVSGCRGILSSLGIGGTDLDLYSGLLARTWMDHYAGDEPNPMPEATRKRIRAWDSLGQKSAASFLRVLATDLPPGDLTATISLR